MKQIIYSGLISLVGLTLSLPLLAAEQNNAQHTMAFAADKKPSLTITSIPVTQIKENEAFSYHFMVNATDSETLTIDYLEVPKKIIRQGNHLYWQTDYNSAGEYPFHIKVTNGGTFVEQKFMLSIINVNRAPIFTQPTQTQFQLTENQPWSLTFAATDADGDKINYRVDNQPQGMQRKDNTLTWQPTFTQAGKYDVTLIANDGKDDAKLTITLQVANVNRPPVITSTPVTQVNETALYQYQIIAEDADNTPLSYRLKSAPEGMHINASNQLIWQTNYDHAGQYTIVIEVSDGEATVQQQYILHVANTNRPVEIVSTPITQIKETEVFEYTFKAFDADNDAITIDYLSVPKQVTRKGEHFYWQTDYNSAGEYTFHIRASDKESSAEQKFTLNVANVNRLPVFTSKPPLTGVETFQYQYILSADDVDNEALTFTLQSAPKGMALHNNQLTWTPDYDQAGKHPIVIHVSDGIDISKQVFTITVTNTNREPYFTNISNQMVYAGNALNYRLHAVDPDADKISFKLIRGPKGMKLKKNGELQWKTTGKNIAEEIIVIVEVSDGDLKSRQHFEVQVLEKPIETKEGKN